MELGVLDGLRAKGLLSVETLERSASVDYEEKYRGALLGGACGDALGRPVESWPPHAIAESFGTLADFLPWKRWNGGPVGTITDDTQLTMCLAASIGERGKLDPADLAERLIKWLPEGRGVGTATREAVLRLSRGVPWWEAGTPAAGNGAAMRAAPIGLFHPLDPVSIRRDAALSAVVTHADAMAAASAVAQAFGVAYCLHRSPSEFDAEAFLVALEDAMSVVPDDGLPERRRGAGPEPVRLIDRIRLAVELRAHPPQRVFERLYNGGFVLESLPAAVYCFAASPDDPERVIVTAVNAGYDADTVAAMAGNLAGALNGATALPDRWLSELEYRAELEDLAMRLLDLSPLGREERA